MAACLPPLPCRRYLQKLLELRLKQRADWRLTTRRSLLLLQTMRYSRERLSLDTGDLCQRAQDNLHNGRLHKGVYWCYRRPIFLLVAQEQSGFFCLY
jgi:hypothetical protein